MLKMVINIYKCILCDHVMDVFFAFPPRFVRALALWMLPKYLTKRKMRTSCDSLLWAEKLG